LQPDVSVQVTVEFHQGNGGIDHVRALFVLSNECKPIALILYHTHAQKLRIFPLKTRNL
jgi:hypothetical protein